VGRNAVRLAIGQLFDYRRHASGDWAIGILLPRKPEEDLINLCTYVGAGVAWQLPDADFLLTSG